jgi:hypothetical protein
MKAAAPATAFAWWPILVATLERACHVAEIARALTWERAVRTSRNNGSAVDDEWTAAPHETLTTVLHRSYLGDP